MSKVVAKKIDYTKLKPRISDDLKRNREHGVDNLWPGEYVKDGVIHARQSKKTPKLSDCPKCAKKRFVREGDGSDHCPDCGHRERILGSKENPGA